MNLLKEEAWRLKIKMTISKTYEIQFPREKRRRRKTFQSAIIINRAKGRGATRIIYVIAYNRKPYNAEAALRSIRNATNVRRVEIATRETSAEPWCTRWIIIGFDPGKTEFSKNWLLHRGESSPKGLQIAAWPKRSRKWHTVLEIMGEIAEFRVLDDRPWDWFHGAHSQDPRHVRVGQAGQKSDLSYLVRRASAPYVACAGGHASNHQSWRIRHRVL